MTIRSRNGGVTLIELAIVLFIIGILAAITIPAYKNYIAHSAISEPVSLMGGMKTTLAEWYANHQSWPILGKDVQVVTSGNYTASIEIFSFNNTPPGNLTLMATWKPEGLRQEINNTTVVMFTTDGGATWTCSPGGPRPTPARFLPNACR